MNPKQVSNIVTLLFLLNGAVNAQTTEMTLGLPLTSALSRIKRQCCASCTNDNCSCGGCPSQSMKQVMCPEHCQPLCTNSCVMEIVSCPGRCQPMCTNSCVLGAPPPLPSLGFQCSAQCMPNCEPSCIGAPTVMQPRCESRCMPTCSPQCMQTVQVQQTCTQSCMPSCQPSCLQAMQVRQMTTTCIDACMPNCQPSCVQAVTCSSCMNDCPAMCGQPKCVHACMPRCLPKCIQAVQVRPRPGPMLPCTPGCGPPTCSPLCAQQTCPPQCQPSCSPSCMQQFGAQLSPSKDCAFECMPSCEASCLAQVTCSPQCIPACAPSCVSNQPPGPPMVLPPTGPIGVPPFPHSGPQCPTPCMPACLPACIQRLQTAQIAVPCGNPCICQPGYVQCAEAMCCLKYKNMAKKFRKMKATATTGEVLHGDQDFNSVTLQAERIRPSS